MHEGGDAHPRGANASTGAPARQDLVDRPMWRRIFLVYAVALTIGTHWPRLQMGTESMQAPDKLIHAGAFGVLTLLLWRTGWFRRLVTLALLGLSWCVLDELSQAVPGLGRETSWEDMVASSTGVVMAVAFLWALRPVGGPASRIRHDRWHWSVETALRRPLGQTITVCSAVVFGVIGAVAGGALSMIFIVPMPVEVGMIGLGIGLAVGTHLAIELVRRRALRVMPDRVCYRCGHPSAATFDEHGLGACAACGGALHAGQWFPPATQNPPDARRRLAFAAGVVTAFLVAGFGLYLVALGLRLRVPAIGAVLEGYNRLGDDMRLVIDLGWIAVVLAVATRLFRAGVARAVDGQDQRCLGCGFDLRSTPAAGGVGRCGECGAVFLRWPAASRGHTAPSAAR